MLYVYNVWPRRCAFLFAGLHMHPDKRPLCIMIKHDHRVQVRTIVEFLLVIITC